MTDTSDRDAYGPVLSALADKSGEDIVVMDMEGEGALADAFILTTGSSEVHMRTLMDAAEEALERGGRSCRREGDASPNWRLLDAGDVVVHVFSHKGRELYKIERLLEDLKIFRHEQAQQEGRSSD